MKKIFFWIPEKHSENPRERGGGERKKSASP
jgi:hypothetical protein